VNRHSPKPPKDSPERERHSPIDVFYEDHYTWSAPAP
jgi:hypothetical protein